jgi:uncharacterized protein YdhG (YjbR/CyaY superfamily)
MAEGGLMSTRPRTIDDYLAGLRADDRAALEAVRAAIRSAAPKAEECISYGLPAFRLNGRILVAFKAATNHCALHPMSSSTVAAHRTDLVDYDTSPGTIRFQPAEPLPPRLIRKLVKARIAEISAKARASRRRSGGKVGSRDSGRGVT